MAVRRNTVDIVDVEFYWLCFNTKLSQSDSNISASVISFIRKRFYVAYFSVDVIIWGFQIMTLRTWM